MSMQYAFDLDETHWVRVPLAFPDGDDADVFAWARRVADALAPQEGDLRQALMGRATELAAVPGPREGAAERLWLLPSPDAPEMVAHLYFADAEGSSAEDFATIGTGGGVQVARQLDGTRFDEAVAVEILEETDAGVLMISRRVARAGDTIALLESIDGAPSAAQLEGAAFDELLRGLVVQGA